MKGEHTCRYGGLIASWSTTCSIASAGRLVSAIWSEYVPVPPSRASLLLRYVGCESDAMSFLTLARTMNARETGVLELQWY